MNIKASIFFTSIFVLLASLYAENYNLSIASIFKDEAPFMKEWIDYHILQGVEHFYLYNNDSTDNFKSVLRPYIHARVVTLIDWSDRKSDLHGFCFETQPAAYNDAVSRCKKTSKWLAVIDLDEFIIPICENSITEVLEKHFPKSSGICINWQCYGTSGIWEFPEGKMLENLIMKMRWDSPRNRHCKVIVNPRHVSTFDNPHCCNFINTHYAVDTELNRCSGYSNEVHIDKLRINHYWTRDEKYLYQKKIPRYLSWNPKNTPDDLIDTANSMNEEYDQILK